MTLARARRPRDRETALRLFTEFQAAFPWLRMQLQPEDPNVDVGLDIPEQEGLPFRVWLSLQADELHLQAGRSFWLEWFPTSWPDVVEEYRDAVLGLLYGRYRIVEYHRGDRIVKARLQRPAADAWRTIGTSSRLSFLPWPRMTETILQAAGGRESPPS